MDNAIYLQIVNKHLKIDTHVNQSQMHVFSTNMSNMWII